MANYQVPFIQVIKDLVQTYEWSRRRGQSFNSYVIDILAKGNTMVDIGTHSFSYLYYLNKAVGKKGNLFLFETDLKRCTQLNRLQKFFSLKNTKIRRAGCLQTNTAAIIPLKDYKRQNPPYSVAEQSLDEICKQNNIQPGFIRINTRGNNDQILKGAVQIIKACRPTIIMRCDERAIGREKVLSIFKFFKALNYRGFFMLDTIKLPLQNFDFSLYQNTCSNFYCDQFVFEPY
jgi:FkbM family methyltransferase